MVRLRFAAPLILCLIGSAAQADVTRIWLLRAGSPDRGTHLWIEKAQASDTKGTLHGIISGQPLPLTPSVPTDKLIVDSQGFVSGGTITLPAKNFTDIGKSSLDLKLAAGAVLTVDASTGVTLKKAEVSIGLPIGKNGSTQPTVQLNSDLVFQKNGNIHIDVNSGSLTSGANKLGLAGFSLSSIGGVHVLWDHKPGSANDDFACELSNVTLGVPLPGLLSQDDASHAGGISVKASKLTIDADGNVSADGDLTMDSSQGAQIMPLAKPMDFILTVKTFSCTLTKGEIKPQTLKVDLTLPASFTTDVDKNPDRVTIHDIELKTGNDLYIHETPKFICRWHGFRLTAPDGWTLDLSETQGKGKNGDLQWEGLQIPTATLTISDQLKKSDNTTPFEVDVKDAIVDEHGFTGKVDVSGSQLASAKLADLDAKLTEVKLTIERGEIMDGGLGGTLSGIPGIDGTLKLAGSLSAAGAFGLEVSTPSPITVSALSSKIQVDHGKFDLDPSGVGSLLLTGSLTVDDAVDTVGGAVFRFTNLSVDKTGLFAGDTDQEVWMDLPEPFTKEFGPISIEVAKVGLGKKKRPLDGNTGTRRLFMSFDGGAALGGDLPVSIGGDFEGLYLWASAPGSNGPDIDVGGLHVDLGIDGILTLSGDLRTDDATLPVSKKKVGDVMRQKGIVDSKGRPLRYLYGDIDLGLPILQTATPLSASLSLLVAPHSWYVLGGAAIPAIPLGQSGIGIGGFFAGIGHNVARYPAGASGIPSVNYDLLPDPDNKTQNSTLFTITAGARLLAMIPPPPPPPAPQAPMLWGDFALTVDTSPLNVSLNGNLFLADPPLGTVGIPADPKDFSRVLSGSVGIRNNPDLEFYAHLGTDINVPTRKEWFAREHGAVDLTVNKSGIKLLAGGPIHADSANHTVQIDNPFELELNTAKLGLPQLAPLQGALTFNAFPMKNGQPTTMSLSDPPTQLQATLEAAMRWNQTLSKSGTVDIGTTINYEASGTLDLETYFKAQTGISATAYTLTPNDIHILSAPISLSGPNAYFYGDTWAKAAITNARIKASKGFFSAEASANLAGWLEGQFLLYYGGLDAGAKMTLEGDLSGNVAAKLGPKTFTFPVSVHHKLESN